MALIFVQRYLSAPVFADKEQTLEARKLWAVLISLAATVTTLFPVLAMVLPHTTLRAFAYVGTYDGFFIALFFMARRGRTRLVSALLIISCMAIASVSLWSAGGLRAPGILAYPLLVGIAGILEGPVAAFLTGLGCASIAVFFWSADRFAFLPPPSIAHTPTSILVALLFILGEFVVIQVMVSWVVRRAEARAKASAVESERTEKAMRESQDKFVKVFQASPDAIIITELETGTIIEVNPSYEKLFGYSRDELVGRTTVSMGIFKEPKYRAQLVDDIKLRGAIRDRTMDAWNRKREIVPLEFSGELIELGGRTCMVSIVHDITERRQAEDRERRSRDEFTQKLIASQEAERRRIAAELHDSLGQNLILIKNRAQLALGKAAASPDLGAQFSELQDMAARAIAEVRQISHHLRPHHLDQLGLTQALGAMVDAVALSSNIPIERKLDPVDDLFSPEAATHVYRIAQETISNILKHAQAKSVRVKLERDVRDVRLWIEDDGQGFSPPSGKSPSRSGGLGLNSIAERVRILGGILKVDSIAGKGTRVEAVIPHSGKT